MAGNLVTLCEFICSIIFPPLGVFAHRGCGCDLLINILLTILGYFPGVIHAILIICCTASIDNVPPPQEHVVVVHHVETV